MVSPRRERLRLGPKWTTIRVVGNTLRIKNGWAFAIDVPLKDIKSVKRINKRPLAWGVHPMGDAWMVNGSRDGIVELKLRSPIHLRHGEIRGRELG